MDLSLTEEQQMLADSVARYINDSYDFETRQKIAASEQGFSRDTWSEFAELGWLAVPFSEQDGGLKGGAVELMLMMEAFGQGLLVEPYLANIVLAGGVLRRLANEKQKDQWLARLIEGDLQMALAFAEPQARFEIQDIKSTAVADEESFVLNGKKTMVLNGGHADLLIIPARSSGDQNSTEGITLFAVPSSAAGLSRQSYRTVDAQQAAEISLENVIVSAEAVLGEVGRGFDTLQSVIDEACMCVCAEAAGIIRCMHEKTVEYSKTRVQFGLPIGSFQALQHRMADTLMACEQTRSLLLWCSMVNASGGSEARSSIHALKYQIGTAGVHVAREAVQLHGGMGVTWELDIGHYFKRLTAISLMFGDADFHLDKYVELTRAC